MTVSMALFLVNARNGARSVTPTTEPRDLALWRDDARRVHAALFLVNARSGARSVTLTTEPRDLALWRDDAGRVHAKPTGPITTVAAWPNGIERASLVYVESAPGRAEAGLHALDIAVAARNRLPDAAFQLECSSGISVTLARARRRSNAPSRRVAPDATVCAGVGDPSRVSFGP